MPLRLSPAALASIRQHAEQGYPSEVCGVLLGTLHDDSPFVTRARGAPNAAGVARDRSFALHPRDILAAEDEAAAVGEEILGFYHTHCDVPASPSLQDEQAAWPFYAHVIVSVLRGRVQHVSAWRKHAQDARLHEDAIRD